MKIMAIRLAECGRFQQPVALEGLSGRLDVLAGPNEMGKSTVLRSHHSKRFERGFALFNVLAHLNTVKSRQLPLPTLTCAPSSRPED